MARLYKRSRKPHADTATEKLSFILNDEPVELENVAPDLTVLDYLRNEKNLTGTKQGCSQGGCGSCTVTIGEMQGSAIHYRAVNSCLCFTASLHNKHLITIEGITKKGKLHPAQQTLLNAQAIQCGFCAPGFVMSMYTMCHQPVDDHSRQSVCDGLNGNLCRCTGYKPIITATLKLLRRKNLPAFAYDQQHVLAQLKKTNYKTAQTFTCKGRSYHSPVTPDEVARLMQKHADAVLVAGGTDIAVNHVTEQKKIKRVISIERVAALKMIRKGKDMFAFGAGVTLNEVSAAIAEDYPDLKELIRRFGSHQIRNKATMIGNIANADPAADMPAALIVLDAKITLRVGNYRRFLMLEDFFIDAGRQNIKPGEFIESLQIPRARRTSVYRVYKLSKRFEHDIASVIGAFMLRLDSENVVRDIRICFSAMDVIPKRARRVEQALLDEQWSLQNVNKVIPLFDKDYQPLSDYRGSAVYRMIAAKNLLKRFYLETQSDSIQTRLTGENHGR